MKVAVFPSDASGCGWYRLRWSALELARQGFDVEIRESVTALWERGPERDIFRGVRDLNCDVAVFQRVFHRTVPIHPNGKTDGVSIELIEAVQKQGVRVVVDLDDDLGAVDPHHVGYPFLKDCEPIVKEACRMADLVTVSTPALAKRYGPAVVIPNGITRAYLGIERSETHTLPVIGWTGSPLTHVGDLLEVGVAVRDLCADGQAAFRAIGKSGELTLRELGIPRQQMVKGGDLASLEYARIYAQLDVAIVPLKFSRFNAGKSWLKMLEAAALGVPVVGSPSPENVRLNVLGVGLIAERQKDWRVALADLCASPDLRLSMAAQGRAVASEWTIEERIAPMCWSAWNGASIRSVEKVGAFV